MDGALRLLRYDVFTDRAYVRAALSGGGELLAVRVGGRAVRVGTGELVVPG